MALLSVSKFCFDPRDKGERIKTALAEGLYHCTMCEKCRQVCPLQIDVPQIAVEGLRVMAVRRKLAPSAIHEERRALILKTGSIVQTLKPSLLDRTKETLEIPDSAGVGLFLGCLINCDERLQGIGEDAIRVLARSNMSVTVPRDQVCCGLPASTVGYDDVIELLANTNIEIFGKLGADYLITLCAGCGMVLKRYYPDLAGERDRSLPEILDFSEVLAKNPRDKLNPISESRIRVAYSDPCHLYRGQSVFDQPRRLIKSIPGIDLVEVKESDVCCGGGGGLPTTNSRLSLSIAEKKVGMMLRENVNLVVTSCPTCILQLSIAVKRKHAEMKVLHIASLLQRAYDGAGAEEEERDARNNRN
jgi:fumarate reductase (CoM/CoB) subunit B